MAEWKETKYAGYYVSDAGEVRGTKILKPMKAANGYLYVNIYTEPRKYKSVKVHRLVAEAFVENPNGLNEIDHINTIRTDNRAENLKWVTHEENMNNAETVKKERESKRGKMMPVNMYDIEGNFLSSFESVKAAARGTGYRNSTIYQVCTGKMKQTDGKIFKFV